MEASTSAAGTSAPIQPSGRRIALAYLRNDLRIHDNPSLYYAHNHEEKPTHILPIYVFDERQIECSCLPGYERKGDEARTRLCGFWRSGVFKTRFLTEAVYDLQHRLREQGSGLLIRFGYPEDVIENVIKALHARGDEVVGLEIQKEICAEEVAVEKRLDKRLAKLGMKTARLHETKQMIHREDLPFSIEDVPDVFTPFRKRVEALGDKMVRQPLDMPDKFLPFPHTEYEPIRDDENYGRRVEHCTPERMLEYLFEPLKGSYEMKYSRATASKHASTAFPWAGGETPALERIDYYFLEGKPPPVARYKETRNMLLGHAYSTKMSPYLAIGCVSARQITKAIDVHEAKYGASQNTYWVRFEMLWRDYFIYVAQKFGNNLFKLEGYEGVTDPKQAAKKAPGWNDWDSDNFLIKAWLRGRTGVPFIDANIIELRETGFMSNRGRQNVASFLSKDLYFDWRIGAEFYESHLIDYEPTANWGNWQYVAGVGNDPRASRQFNPIKQARDYDPHGDYVRTWIEQLEHIPASKVHTPWLLTDSEWTTYLEGTNIQQRATAARKRDSNRQALSTAAVGKLGKADAGSWRKGKPQGQAQSGRHSQNRSEASTTPSVSDSEGNACGDGKPSSNSNLGSEGRDDFTSDSGSGAGVETGSGSGSGSASANVLFTEGSASESTGVSSYESSEVGGEASDANKSADNTSGMKQGMPKLQRSPSTNGSSSSDRSTPQSVAPLSENVGGKQATSGQSLETSATHRSASALNKSLAEDNDFMPTTPYPRQPLFEQEAWKPHYHRRDFGRRRGGPGGGNSRRLLRTPDPRGRA